MKQRKLILFIAMCCLFSCSHKVEVIETVSFNSGYIQPLHRYVGTFTDPQIGVGIYMLDANIYQEVKLFDLKGNLLETIPLERVCNDIFRNKDVMGGVTIYSMDTILVSSSYYSLNYVVNRKGEVIKKMDVSTLVPDSIKPRNNYMISYIPNPDNILDINHIYLGVQKEYQHIHDMKFPDDSPEPYILTHTEWLETPALMQVNNLMSDTASYTFHLPAYQRIFANEPHGICFNRYKILDDKIFIFNPRTATLMEVNKEDNSVYRLHHITSGHKENKGSYISTEESLKRCDNDPFKALALEDDLYYKGFHIANIFKSNQKEAYYVILTHSVTDEEYEKYAFNYRTFSILEYDYNFKLKREYLFPPDYYNCRIAFMTPNGLMIKRKTDNLNIDNYGTQTFDLLNLN